MDIDLLSSPLDVADRILGDEDSQTEFKAPRIDGRRITGKDADEESFAGEIVAFANEVGGVILVGVEDGGAFAGYSREDAQAASDWVVNVARNNVVPPVNPIIRTFQLDGPTGPVHVVAAHVDRGLLHRTGGGRWYRRVGSSKRDMDAVELERLIHERGARFAFDESPVPGVTLDDLDDALLVDTFPRSDDLDWQQLLRHRRILTDDVEPRPTIAGLLGFGRAPEEHLPQALIRKP
jgi:ATP-dependent DNA helicase RecG